MKLKRFLSLLLVATIVISCIPQMRKLFEFILKSNTEETIKDCT